MRHRYGTECTFFGEHSEPNRATQRALALIGKPEAKAVCIPGGDTDLAWAGMFMPGGFSFPYLALASFDLWNPQDHRQPRHGGVSDVPRG